MIIVTGAFGLLGRRVLAILGSGRDGATGTSRVLAIEHPRAAVPRNLRPLFKRDGRITLLRADLAVPGEPARALIPPAADRNPDLAEAINVRASGNLAAWTSERCGEARFLYASSISVYGDRRSTPPIRTDDPLVPGDDGYARTKAAAEELIRGSGLDWRILRFSYLVAPEKLRPDPLMFRMPLDTVIEVCHADDAALAVVRSISGNLSERVYNIAGGPWCRSSYREYLQQMLGIFGLAPGSLPGELFSRENYHCGAMDTRASAGELEYQRTTLAGYYRQVYRRKAFLRPLVYRFRYRIWRRILLGSAYFRGLEEGLRSRIIVSLMNFKTSA
jgi:nucleoside-diphosphate-sugar epimerase